MKIIAMLLAIASAPALAMQCQMQTPEKISKSAVIAFVGTVAKIEESKYKPHSFCTERSSQGPECGGKLVTINVTEKIRGRVDSSVTVLKEDGCYCLGGYWKVGASYLVVAQRNTTRIPGQLVASNVCGGTGEIGNEIGNETKPVIDALRDPKL